MKTPEGWARINLLLRTLQEPPKKGTLRESALVLLLMQQEGIEHARFRAMAQIVIDQKAGIEAFEEYMKLAFPYLEASKAKDKAQFIDLMKREVAQGPLVVTPQEQPKARSKLKQRVVRAQARSNEQVEGLATKLGDALLIR